MLVLPGALFCDCGIGVGMGVRSVDSLQGVISRSDGMRGNVGCGDSLSSSPGSGTGGVVRAYIAGGRMSGQSCLADGFHAELAGFDPGLEGFQSRPRPAVLGVGIIKVGQNAFHAGNRPQRQRALTSPFYQRQQGFVLIVEIEFWLFDQGCLIIVECQLKIPSLS
jgi:hypothetical protein